MFLIYNASKQTSYKYLFGPTDPPPGTDPEARLSLGAELPTGASVSLEVGGVWWAESAPAATCTPAHLHVRMLSR